MSHDTHTGHDKETERKKSITSFSASFWFIIILVVLFIGAINFVSVMSKGEGEGESKEPQKTEAPATPGRDEKHTPTENQIPNTNGTTQMSSDSAASR